MLSALTFIIVARPSGLRVTISSEAIAAVQQCRIEHGYAVVNNPRLKSSSARLQRPC
jgi:hypothetical protein